MIVIDIREEEVLKAKELRDILDSNKSYNKIDCPNNYIGILGELVFHRYLIEQGIPHTWVDFNKPNKGFNEPDFFIGNLSIDIKTTYSEVMWFQKPKHDIYIYIQVAKDNGVLRIYSWLTKNQLYDAINSNIVRKVLRDNRTDYIISPKDMSKIEIFMELIKEV